MKILSVILILLLFQTACSEKISDEVAVLESKTAVSQAREYFNKHGYRPITIASFGEQYHGKRNHPKDVVDCVFGGDLSLQIVRVESVQYKESIEFVNLYNDEASG